VLGARRDIVEAITTLRIRQRRAREIRQDNQRTGNRQTGLPIAHDARQHS
jgi:hypothetical protein